MRKFLLIASAAAVALSTPVFAEKGGKGGGGNGGGNGHAAQAQGGGGGKGPGGGGHAKAPKAVKAERQAFHGGGGHAQAPKLAKAERQQFHGGGKPAKAERQAFRAPKQERKAERQLVRAGDLRGDRAPDLRGFRGNEGQFAGFRGNCPPGLAKKGCMPPGQAKKAFRLGQQVQPAWFGGYNVPSRYSAFFQDSPESQFRYSDDGYIYRIDPQNNLVSGLIPLLGGGFAVGQPMPAGYDVYNVPYQYRDDFYDTDDSLYRYGDDAIYQVNPRSGMIESIVALLGGGNFNVGQQLPSGYDVYNVPMDYRDEYQDTDDSMYRYADGNIYQVDTKTQIIQAIMEMLV